MYLSGMLFVLIAVAMNNSRQIKHPGISALSFLFYACILIFQIIMIIRRFGNKDDPLKAIQTNLSDPRDAIQEEFTAKLTDNVSLMSELGSFIKDNLEWLLLSFRTYLPSFSGVSVTGLASRSKSYNPNDGNTLNQNKVIELVTPVNV